MKFVRALPSLALVPLVLGFSSCREETVEPAPAEEAEVAPVEVPAPAAEESVEVVTLDPAERAAMLGFAARIDAEAEGLLAVYDGAGMLAGLKGLKVAQLFAEEDAAVPPDVEFPSGDFLSLALDGLGALLGEEVVVVQGPGSAERTGPWNQLGGRLNYYQARMMVGSLLKAGVTGEVDALLGELGDNRAWLMEMLGDAQEYLPLLEELRIPPLLIALKQSDAEARAAMLGQIQTVLALLGGMAEPLTIERGEARLDGLQLPGEVLVGMLAADPTALDEAVGRETREALLEILAEKRLVFAAGEIDESLVFFLGDDAEDCLIAEDLEASIVAGDELAFIDAEQGRPLHALAFAREELIEAWDYPALKDTAEGLRDGVGVLGDTREFSALLDLVVEKEALLRELHEAGDFGALMVSDEGLRVEIRGGLDDGSIDYAAPHRLPMPDGPTLLRGGWVAGEEFDERAMELGAAVIESIYALASRAATLPGQAEAGMAELLEIFDTELRDDVVALLTGLRVAGEGLGGERLLVVDLAGEVPPFPDVPQELMEEGPFVRIGLVAPVLDRAKLGEAWTGIEPALRSLSVTLQERAELPWSLSKPTHSDSDGAVTWYYDALALSDDAKPSVTLSGERMVLSSSRNLAMELVAPTEPSGDEVRSGAWLEGDLGVLREALAETLALFEEQPEALLPDEGSRREFEESLPELRQGLEALEEFEAVELRARKVEDRRHLTLRVRMR